MAAGQTPVMNYRLSLLLRDLVSDLLDGRIYLDNYGAEAFYIRLLLAIGSLQSYYREEIARSHPAPNQRRRPIPIVRPPGFEDRNLLRTSIRDLNSQARSILNATFGSANFCQRHAGKYRPCLAQKSWATTSGSHEPFAALARSWNWEVGWVVLPAVWRRVFCRIEQFVAEKFTIPSSGATV